MIGVLGDGIGELPKMKDKEICPICSVTTRHVWLFHLAKYNSLDPKARVRFNICDDCARKLMAAIKTAIRENESELIRGDGQRQVLLRCPVCYRERATVEPKVPAPCAECGTIFSVYSSAGMRTVKEKKADEEGVDETMELDATEARTEKAEAGAAGDEEAEEVPIVKGCAASGAGGASEEIDGC